MRKNIKSKILTFIFLATMGISSVGMGSFYVKAEEPDEITEEYIKLFEGVEDIETVDASKISIDNVSILGSSYSVDAKASSYDPRKYGNRVTSVKDQYPYGLCWDYASNAAAESVLIKQGLATNSIDLSEIYFAYKGNGKWSKVKRIKIKK